MTNTHRDRDLDCHWREYPDYDDSTIVEPSLRTTSTLESLVFKMSLKLYSDCTC